MKKEVNIPISEYCNMDVEGPGKKFPLGEAGSSLSNFQKLIDSMEFMFQNSPEGIAYCDVEGIILGVNDVFRSMFGYEHDTIIGHRINDIVAQTEDILKKADHVSREIDLGRRVKNDTARNRKDGTVFPVSVLSMPFEISGETLRLDIYHDLSSRGTQGENQQQKTGLGDIVSETGSLEDQKKKDDTANNIFSCDYYEKSQGLTEVKCYSIVDDQLDFVNTLDPDYRITFANRAFCNYFGISRKELLGKNFLELLSHSDRNTMKEQLRSLSRETPIIFTEGTVPLPSGGVIWQQWISKGIFDEEGNLLEILGVGRDITRRKRVEDELKRTIETLQNNFEATINGMGKIIEIKDPYTAGHQQNVAFLARSIAEEMDLPQDKLESVYYASLVHDIGKIQIPSEILNKPGKLNELEYSLVKSHPVHSSEILKTVEFPWPIADIVLQHHERINGSGYPNGIMGEDIMEEAKIMGVADVVEAMSAHRPYRISLGIEKALEEIEAYSGILYDPEVVKACVSLFKNRGFSFERDRGSEHEGKSHFA